jgi:MAX-like protein X
MLAQHQQKPLNSQQAYSNTPTLYNDQSNISQSHISPIQTTTNNFNSLGISSTTNVINQNVLNLSPMQMSIEPQINTSHQSYKTTQGPNYRYHGSSHGNQPYKIPHQSQSDFGVSSSRSHMRQPSPPHVVGSKNVSFQQPNSSAAEAMIRSISLPINPNLQLPSKEVDFLMPKYPQQQQQQHINKERRSSLRQTHPIMPMLQSAASEPSLNVNTSALAQLLTNSQSSLLTGSSKSQSVTSVIHHQQPVRANSFTSTSLLQNQIAMNVNTISGLQQQTKLQSSHQQQQQPSSSTSNTSGIYTPTLSPDSAFQESHDISSPERKMQPREHQRRAGHIHAEQKRRYNIKNGFDMLHSLIPQLQQNPSAKVRSIRIKFLIEI